jgi:hypothetical protein
LDASETRAGLIERVGCAINLSLRGDTRSDQSLLAIQFALLEGECLLRRGEVGLTLQIGRLERFDLERRRRELRLRFLDVDAEWCIVESIEQVAAPHGLVVVHGQLDDSAGHIGTDRGACSHDIGVVGFLVAAATHIEVDSECQNDDGASDQQRQTSALPAIRRRLVDGSGGIGCGHRCGL